MTERPELKPEDDRGEASKGEIALMAFSALVTIAIFGYVAYQAFTLPLDPLPRAEVVSQAVQPNGDVEVTVALFVDGGTGLREAEVEVKCDDPAPAVTFTNVPSLGRREGVVTCPPGTERPEVSIVYYVTA